MLKPIGIALFAAVALQLSSGCAVNRATATAEPGSNVATARSFYVVKQPADQRGIQDLIRDGLARRGYSARVGFEETPPGVEVVVTYVDRWMWDITMYMVELTVTFRNPANRFPLASGNSYHTSLTRLSPQEMVDEVLDNIFAKARRTK